jgi:hypothetical protein
LIVYRSVSTSTWQQQQQQQQDVHADVFAV